MHMDLPSHIFYTHFIHCRITILLMKTCYVGNVVPFYPLFSPWNSLLCCPMSRHPWTAGKSSIEFDASPKAPWTDWGFRRQLFVWWYRRVNRHCIPNTFPTFLHYIPNTVYFPYEIPSKIKLIKYVHMYWSVHRMFVFAWNLLKRSGTHKKKSARRCAIQLWWDVSIVMSKLAHS